MRRVTSKWRFGAVGGLELEPELEVGGLEPEPEVEVEVEELESELEASRPFGARPGDWAAAGEWWP